MWVSSLPLLGSPDFSLSTHLFGVVSWQALSPTFEPLICLLGPIKVVPHCPTWSSGTQPIMATAPRIGLELLIPAVALRPLPGNVGICVGTFSRAANSLLSWGCNLWTLTLEEVPSHLQLGVQTARERKGQVADTEEGGAKREDLAPCCSCGVPLSLASKKPPSPALFSSLRCPHICTVILFGSSQLGLVPFSCN